MGYIFISSLNLVGLHTNLFSPKRTTTQYEVVFCFLWKAQNTIKDQALCVMLNNKSKDLQGTPQLISEEYVL